MAPFLPKGHFYTISGNRPTGNPDEPICLPVEPQRALVAGPEGLDTVGEIVQAAGSFLRPGGALLLEHGIGQDAAVRTLLAAAGLASVAT